MQHIRWGVLSTAKIALEHVIPAMKKADRTEIRAIASRNRLKAEEAAGRLGIPYHYGSYEELLDSPEIDAVYIPLPNHLHKEWTLRAMRAGKHVLCEKPFGMNAGEVAEIRKAAEARPELMVAEAFMYRHHPMWSYVKSVVVSGEIGRIQLIQSHFSYFNANPADIRNKPEFGGGGLMDIGCYCVSSSRFLFGREPGRVVAQKVTDSEFGTDRITSGILDFGNASALFSCSTSANSWQKMVVTGEKGRIEIPIPYNPPHDRQAQVHTFTQGRQQIYKAPLCNQFTLQAGAFARSVIDNVPFAVSQAESEANMKVLDAIALSSENGSWVPVAQLAST